MELVRNKNADFLYKPQELLADPIGIFLKNVPERIGDLILMTGWTAFFICIAGFVYLFLKKKVLSLYLFLWFAAPLFAITYLVKYFAARYMIFLATLIILLAGYFISNIKYKKIGFVLFLLIIIPFLYLDLPILFDYQNLNFPRYEREQYVEGIASGYGMKEIAAFAKEQSEEKQVLIIGEGIFGLGSYIVESALPMKSQNIETTGLWPFTKEGLEQFQPQLKNKKIYVVLNNQVVLSKNGKKIPSDWPLKLIKHYKKQYNTDYFSLYELTH
jgi:hypothetical protein